MHKLYGEVHIPPAVYTEVVQQGVDRAGANEVSNANWIHAERVSESALSRIMPHPGQLHAGEIESIALALQLPANLILLDERLARKAANRLGLQVLGTIGVLKYAREQELLDDLRAALDSLRAHGIRISDTLYYEVLEVNK